MPSFNEHRSERADGSAVFQADTNTLMKNFLDALGLEFYGTENAAGLNHPAKSRGRKQATKIGSSSGSEKKRQRKAVAGVFEWAESSLNWCTGCEHDCIYCFGRAIAMQKKWLTAEQWPREKVREKAVKHNWHKVSKKNCAKTFMAPTMHDITPGNLEASVVVLSKVLAAGHNVLVVSKPHLVCIQRLCEVLAPWKDRLLFRFTIGFTGEKTRQFWEPNAPEFHERLACLKLAYEAGFETSVSAEPLLEPWNVRKLVERLRPFVSHSIWLGKANKLSERTKWKFPHSHSEIDKLLSWQTDEKVREIYELFRDDPIIRWKESYKSVVGIARPEKSGLDI